jgi:hypothetical protein
VFDELVLCPQAEAHDAVSVLNSIPDGVESSAALDRQQPEATDRDQAAAYQQGYDDLSRTYQGSGPHQLVQCLPGHGAPVGGSSQGDADNGQSVAGGHRRQLAC